MTFKPLPHYFIIKIDIKKQQERKEKIGGLYLHFNHVFMERNLQSGEVIAIGSMAANHFPDAEIGDELIVHHFVEKNNLIYEDKVFRYYNVTASSYNGRRNETYGIYRNGSIIPHPEFVFIEPEKKEEEISADKFIEQKTKQVGSLILFESWEESREAKEEKSKILMEEIKNQSKGKSLADDVKRGLEEKQNEAERITASLNKKQYLPYKIAAHNSRITSSKIFALNIAAQLTVELMDKQYIIVETKYCVAVAS